MADKLIYIMNLSFLIASIFCIISFNIKYIYKDLFYIICIFMINVVNIHNSTVFYFISIALSFLLFIKTLSENSINDNKVKKIIFLIITITACTILKLKIEYINLIFIVVSNFNMMIKYIKNNSLKNEEKNRKLSKDINSLKLKENSGMKLLKSSKETNKKTLNIIERKKELLNIILEQNNKCVIIIDKYGYISNKDSNFHKTWKYYELCNYNIKFSNFINSNFTDSIEILLDVQKVYELGREINTELLSKDNKYFECKYTPFIVNGETMGVICIMTDITYKKYSQKIIDYNKIKYKKTIETIPHTIVVTKDRKIIYSNNKNFDIDIHNEKVKSFIFDTEKYGDFEGEIEKGNKKYLNIRKTNFEENNINKEIAVLRDITDYKLLIEDIKKQSNKHSSLVNSIPQGIYIYDFEEKKTVYINDVLLKMSGYKNLNEFNHSHIVKDVAWVLDKFGQDTKFIRHKIKNSLGTYIDVELGGITLEINNKMKCIGIMNDISEKVRAEKLEKEVAKKKIEYKQKNHFFMNMSHELKTPLNLIMSTNQLIQSIFKNEIEKNPSSQIASTTKIVENQSYLSLQIIENIMTLAKVDADFYKPEVGCYDIVSIVEDIITEINRYSKNNQIEFIFDTNMEEKLVYIDPYDIERIILLILSKVIKQSEAKSTVYVDFVDKDSEVEIFIKNKGGYNKGLSLENLSKENIQMNLEVASSIIKMYNGKIYIKENLNYLEIIIKMKLEENYNYEDKKESIINRESIYSQYSMINAL